MKKFLYAGFVFLTGCTVFSAELIEAPEAYPPMSLSGGVVPKDAGDVATGTTVCTNETQATDEIKALARALQNDPLKMYEYVRNQIEYRPTRGVHTGADGCLRAGYGNDWDQSALLSALLRTAGYATRFVYAPVAYYKSELTGWLGADTTRMITLFNYGGITSGEVTGAPQPMLYVYRVWVEAQISGSWFTFDPAFKEMDRFASDDLAAGTGYSRSNFLAAVSSGASVTADYVQNLTVSTLEQKLTSYATNLTAYIRQVAPNERIEDVLGGERIVPVTITNLSTTLPNAYTVYTSYKESWNHIAANDLYTVQVLHNGINQTFKGYEIAGKRLSVFYDANNGYRPKLYLDGTVIATGNTTTAGNSYTVTILTDHPYSSPGFGDRSNDLSVVSGGKYVLVHEAGSASAKQVQRVSDQLRSDLVSGLSTNSEAVIGGSLHLVASSYMQQARLTDEWLARRNHVSGYTHHWVGLAAQTEGFFVDLPGALVSDVALTTNTVDSDIYWLSRSFMDSALEHGVFEQNQRARSISTVRALCLNNQTGDRTYFAYSNNWSAVKSALLNYTVSEKNTLESLINDGYQLILPQNGNITLEEWEGFGYFRHHPLWGDTAYIISGGYHGGHSASSGTVDPAQEQSGGWWSRFLAWFGIGQTSSEEPVDMFTGHYLLDTTDLELGDSSPRGIRYDRFYNSGWSDTDAGLGYGWRHGYHIRARVISDPEAALGTRSPYDAAAQAIQDFIISDLMSDGDDVRDWMVCSMIADWQMQNLTTNAVRIEIGNKETTFIRQPDGSYTPAPNVQAELEDETGAFVLKGRFGTEYRFRSDGWIEEIIDADSNTLSFAYNTATNLQTVTDAVGRTLTLSYTGGRISSVADSTGRQISYGYDTNGNLTAFTDAATNTWTYQYNDAHQIVVVQDPENITTIQNHYDPTGCVTQQISATSNAWNFYVGGGFGIEEDPFGGQTVHRFDDDGRNLGTQNALGDETVNVYDGQGRLIRHVAINGITNLYTYDVNHNLLSKTEADGTPEEKVSYYGYDGSNRLVVISNQISGSEFQVSNFEYDAEYHLTKTIDALGNEITFTYYPNGLLQQKNEGGGQRITSYTYDAYGNINTVTSTDAGTVDLDYDIRGNLIQQKDAKGAETEYVYDNNGRQTGIFYADGSTVSNVYYANGLLQKTMDAKGGVVSNVWNNAYKLQSVRYQDGGVVSNIYDAADRLIATVDQLNNPTTYQLDSIGRIVSVSSAYSVVENSYDVAGNLTNSAVDPNGLGLWTRSTYDALNRPVTRHSPLATEAWQYDSLSRMTNRIDPSSRHWGSEYDALGRKTENLRPSGASEQFVYDTLGNRIGFYNAEGKPITFGFDAQGRVTAITNAIGKVTLFTYDLNGNLIDREDAKNEVTHYVYDSMNRLTNVVNQGLSRASFTYDANGNNVEQASPLASFSFAYDSMNRLIVSTQSVYSVFSVVQNSYDLNGNRTNIFYPGGLNVSYSYDEEDRLTGVTTEYTENTKNFSFGYDGASRLTNIVYPNGVRGGFAYDAESKVTGYSYSGSSNFISRSISRDPRGFKTSENIISGLEPEMIEGEQRMEHNAADQLTKITQRDSWLGGELNQWYKREYGYDDNGCLLLEYVSRELWNTNATIDEYRNEYSWDYDNRLTGTEKTVLVPHDEIDGMTGAVIDRTYTDGPSVSTEYIYDASGVRIGRVHNSVTNYFVIDYKAPLKMPLAETDAQGNITRYYIWSSNGLLAHMDVNPSTGAITATRYYHADEQGSTLALTDENGAVTDQFAYTPYGGVTRTGTTETPFQWLGGIAVQNEGNGLYYMLNRYYSADMRRFISTDPMGIDGGFNLYAYGNMNPLFYTDPFGLEAGSGWFSSIGRAGLDAIGKIWAAPNTIIGLAWGATGFAVGLLPGVDMPTISFNNNAIQFENHPLMPAGSGVTIGNAISYAGTAGERDYWWSPTIGDHERQHTYQGEMLGPAYLPAYGWFATQAWLAGQNPLGPGNRMETGPYSIPPRTW